MPDVAELYRAHRGYLVRLAASYVHSREAAEDVVHEVFTAFLAAELRNPDVALGYLTIAVKNRACSVLRRRRAFVDGEPFQPGSEPSAEQIAVERATVRDALRALPRQQRAALALRFDGLIVSEIAEALHVSQGTVKSHIARGKAALAGAAGAREHAREHMADRDPRAEVT